MPQPKFSDEEIARRAESLYDERIRDKVEAVGSNRGKIIVLDVDSGDYEIDDTTLTAAQRLRERHPDAELYAMRIGYDAVYNLAGPLMPAKQ